MILTMSRCTCKRCDKIEPNQAMIVCPKCGGVRPMSRHYKRRGFRSTMSLCRAPLASDSAIEVGVQSQEKL